MLRDHIPDNTSGRSVDCLCLAGQAQRLLVVPDRCGTILVIPPGSTAVLSPAQVGDLRTALASAAAAATDHS